MRLALFSLEVFIHDVRLGGGAERTEELTAMMKFLDYPVQPMPLRACSQSGTRSAGKSCLFKHEHTSLLSLIKRIPMYIMLTSTSRDGSKRHFLGSCTLPLNGLVDKFSLDWESQGLSVPVVHGERSAFRLLDMMGGEVGVLDIGYRLYCMGNFMLPHVDDTHLIHKTEDTCCQQQQTGKETHSQDTQETETEAAERTLRRLREVHCQTSTAEPSKSVVIQAENPPVEESETQVPDQSDDSSYPQNPPLLFYRATSQFKPQRKQVEQPSINLLLQDLENKLSGGKAPLKYHDEPEVIHITSDRRGKLPEKPDQKCEVIDGMSFPMLSALTEELDHIRKSINKPVVSAVTQTTPRATPTAVSTNRSDRPKSGLIHSMTGSRKQRHPAPTSGGDSHRRLCEIKHETKIPARKSWIRTESFAPVKGSSRLEYGLTHTYLARIKTANPALFSSLHLDDTGASERDSKGRQPAEKRTSKKAKPTPSVKKTKSEPPAPDDEPEKAANFGWSTFVIPTQTQDDEETAVNKSEPTVEFNESHNDEEMRPTFIEIPTGDSEEVDDASNLAASSDVSQPLIGSYNNHSNSVKVQKPHDSSKNDDTLRNEAIQSGNFEEENLIRFDRVKSPREKQQDEVLNEIMTSSQRVNPLRDSINLGSSNSQQATSVEKPPKLTMPKPPMLASKSPRLVSESPRSRQIITPRTPRDTPRVDSARTNSALSYTEDFHNDMSHNEDVTRDDEDDESSQSGEGSTSPNHHSSSSLGASGGYRPTFSRR